MLSPKWLLFKVGVIWVNILNIPLLCVCCLFSDLLSFSGNLSAERGEASAFQLWTGLKLKELACMRSCFEPPRKMLFCQKRSIWQTHTAVSIDVSHLWACPSPSSVPFLISVVVTSVNVSWRLFKVGDSGELENRGTDRLIGCGRYWCFMETCWQRKDVFSNPCPYCQSRSMWQQFYSGKLYPASSVVWS